MPNAFALALALGALIATRATAVAAPSPSPAPSPPPAMHVSGVYSIAAFRSFGANASGALDTPTGSDLTERADIGNLLLNVTASDAKFSGAATIGGYAFPTVGAALNPTFQSGANTSLYGALPLLDLAYAPNEHLSFMAGKLSSMLGPENAFTYQNVNIERGIGWALEPAVTRGARLTYTTGAWSAAIEDDDGFYSGHYGTLSWMLAYAPSAASSLSFAAVEPPIGAPPNVTASIANKSEYDLMYSRVIGKWSLQPYLLFVRSPAAASLGYMANERASLAALLGSYAFSSRFSLGFRYENARNASAPNAIGANADLLGYGPGSAAQSFTLTPTYHFGTLFARAEIARVVLSGFTAGLGFGSSGSADTQTRIGLELGVQP
ncbi:MAG: outer membrane beta-barrel protein [Candidatus Eremiobacteraeota bacterium]|nr:outer membrane beta-barrel protein [Candidatus Eremiobacteraeota bacterium]